MERDARARVTCLPLAVPRLIGRPVTVGWFALRKLWPTTGFEFQPGLSTGPSRCVHQALARYLVDGQVLVSMATQLFFDQFMPTGCHVAIFERELVPRAPVADERMSA
jgi:hypothetical protein